MMDRDGNLFQSSQYKKRKLNPSRCIRKSASPCYFPEVEAPQDLIKGMSTGLCVNETLYVNKLPLQSQFCKWVMNEYFYSHLDYTYFTFNEFRALLQKVGLTAEEQTIQSWRRIKKAMGKPRRFSKAFIDQEHHKLIKFRSIVRNYFFDNSYQIDKHIKNLELLETLSRLAPYNVGQIVTAIHPVCGHIHQGTVLSTSKPQIFVRFSNPELGVHKIDDQYVALEERFQVSNELRNITNNQESKALQFQTVVQDLDIWAMAFLTKILEQKQRLIQLLKETNDLVERDPSQLTKEVKERYAWIGTQISNLDKAKRNVLTKFRLRGTGSYPLSQISENLDKILAVPLVYMERELEQNENNEDTCQGLKQIINKIQDDKISRDLSQLMQNHVLPKLDNDELQPFIGSLIGILLTLNMTGDINLQNNQFMKQLTSFLKTQTTQTQFQEINETIIRIVSK